MFKVQKRIFRPSMAEGQTKKFYLKEAKTEALTAPRVYKEIERITSLTSSDMKAFSDALEGELIDMLLNNRSVQLGDLGTFRCSLKNKKHSAVSDPELATVRRCVDRVIVRFTPSPALKKSLEKGQGIEFVMIPGDEQL